MIAMLERGGAVSVTKRADADVLVVDMTSMFVKTVKAEQEKNGRDWQRLVERDWVEACVREGRLIWTPKEEDNQEREDSTEEEPNRVESRKGPGRPTGV